MKQLVFISAVFLLLLASCGSNKEIATQNKALYETKWLLKKIYSENDVKNVSTTAFIRFIREKQSAGGNGSCNSFGSNTTISENQISFKNIFSTKMYCEGVQETEDAFFRELEKVNRFEIKDNTLLLYQNEEVSLEFESE